MTVDFVLDLEDDWLKMCYCALKRFVESKAFLIKSKDLEKAMKSDFHQIEKHTRIKIAVYYHNLVARLFKAKPRNVIECNGFVCPEKFRNGYNALKQDIIQGRQLFPRMSRKIRQIDYSDGMLNDWGITHFHLGTLMCSDGVQCRGEKMIAYAFLTDDTVYMIAIGPHKQWDNRSLLEKLMREHGASITFGKASGNFCDISSNGSLSRIELRKANINLITRINGENYLPANLITKDGMLLQAHICLQERLAELRCFEKAVKEKIEDIVTLVVKSNEPLSPKIKISLLERLVEGNDVIYSASIGARFGFLRYDGLSLEILPFE